MKLVSQYPFLPNLLSCHSGRGIFHIDLGEAGTKSVNNIYYLNTWHEEFEGINAKRGVFIFLQAFKVCRKSLSLERERERERERLESHEKRFRNRPPGVSAPSARLYYWI